MTKNRVFILFFLIWISFLYYFSTHPQETYYKDKNDKSTAYNIMFEDYFVQYYVAKSGLLDKKGFYFVPNIVDIRGYPPSTSLLYFPFLYLDYYPSAILFLILNFLLFLGIIYYIFKNSVYYKKHYILFFFIITLFYPLWQNFEFNQLSVIILFCIIFAYHYIFINPNIKLLKLINSFILACSLHIKLFSIIFLFLLFIKKKFKDLFFIIFFVFLIFLISLIWINIKEYTNYFLKIAPLFSKTWVIQSVNNHSFLSLITRLLGYSYAPNQYLFYYPKIIKPLTFLINFIFLYFFYCLTKKTDNHKIILASAITTGIIIFPVNWNHTLTLMLYPLLVMLELYLQDKSNKKILIYFIVCFLLISIDIDFSKFNIKPIFYVFTVYRLIGSILVFIFFYRYKIICKSSNLK